MLQIIIVLTSLVLILLAVCLVYLDNIHEMVKNSEMQNVWTKYKPAYTYDKIKEVTLKPIAETSKKTTVYNPSIDPMGEFSGKHDDFYGEKNE